MRVLLMDGRTFDVQFKKLKASYQYGSKRDKQKIDTFCKIFMNGQPVSQGFAGLSHLDQYNKWTGKKVALAKALKDGPFSKADRKLFWTVFHATFLEVL